MSLEIKTHLQNLSNEMGCVETELSYMAAKLNPSSTRSQKHDVLIQALDRISKLRERLKNEENAITKELSCL
jgi:hypothetical protein